MSGTPRGTQTLSQLRVTSAHSSLQKHALDRLVRTGGAATTGADAHVQYAAHIFPSRSLGQPRQGADELAVVLELPAVMLVTQVQVDCVRGAAFLQQSRLPSRVVLEAGLTVSSLVPVGVADLLGVDEDCAADPAITATAKLDLWAARSADTALAAGSGGDSAEDGSGSAPSGPRPVVTRGEPTAVRFLSIVLERPTVAQVVGFGAGTAEASGLGGAAVPGQPFPGRCVIAISRGAGGWHTLGLAEQDLGGPEAGAAVSAPVPAPALARKSDLRRGLDHASSSSRNSSSSSSDKNDVAGGESCESFAARVRLLEVGVLSQLGGPRHPRHVDLVALASKLARWLGPRNRHLPGQRLGVGIRGAPAAHDRNGPPGARGARGA